MFEPVIGSMRIEMSAEGVSTAARKVKGIRFSTLEKICVRLDCQPGDILERTPEPGNGDVHAEV
jgi:DNA-binding Xre family transcriptional regulator